MSVAKALYRDLVASARRLDAHTSLRALVSFDLRSLSPDRSAKTHLPHADAFNRALLRFLNGRHFYLPASERPTLLQIVREEFRNPSISVANGDALDTAFLALRALNETLAQAQELGLPIEDQEEETTLDGVQLAESVATGVFLLAHPLLEGIFSRAVVVLTEHSDNGSKGYIVNKMTKKTLLQSFKVPSRITRAFGSCDVRRGGPVFTENAGVLHGRAEFGGQRVVTTNFPMAKDPSLFVGVDLETAARAIYDETAKQSDVVFLTGVSAWYPGQLDTEMKQGSWVAVKAPVSLALNAPGELWEDMMRTLGSEYAEMSRMPPIREGDE